MTAKTEYHPHINHDSGSPAMKDPVCGMNVTPQSAAGSASHAGETYYFCSQSCLSKFTSDPSKYVKAQPEPPAPKPHQGEYTCPMHPEIVRDHPGNCPICGMALEPRTVTVDEEENSELVDMRRRFWVSAALSVPV